MGYSIKIKHPSLRFYVFCLLLVVIYDYLLSPLPLLAAPLKPTDAQCVQVTISAVRLEARPVELVHIEGPLSGGQCALGRPLSAKDKRQLEQVLKKWRASAKKPLESGWRVKDAKELYGGDQKPLKSSYHGYHVLTAYTSEAAQTDASPCTTANGFNVCKHGKEDTIAANFLPFGTKVMIPEVFGQRVFVVRDRMNKRHAQRVDIWFVNKQDAIKFGVRKAKIQIVNET